MCGYVGVLFGQPYHVLQGMLVWAKHVKLLLGKVAYAQAFALRDVPREQGLCACNGFDEGGFALPVCAQYAYALACQHRTADVLQDDGVALGNGRQCLACAELVGVQGGTGAEVAQSCCGCAALLWLAGAGGVVYIVVSTIRGAVAKAGIAHAEHGVGELGWLDKFKGKVGAGEDGGYALHALKRLDAALRLFGFGGFGFEAVDEFLQVGDFVLLAGKGGLLQGDLLGA